MGCLWFWDMNEESEGTSCLKLNWENARYSLQLVLEAVNILIHFAMSLVSLRVSLVRSNARFTWSKPLRPCVRGNCGCSGALGLSDGPLVTPDPVHRRCADRLFHIPAHATLLTSAGRCVGSLCCSERCVEIGLRGGHQIGESLNCVIMQVVP
jgi:hypothetical protein